MVRDRAAFCPPSFSPCALSPWLPLSMGILTSRELRAGVNNTPSPYIWMMVYSCFTAPLTTIPNLHKARDTYGVLSGYKVNASKTEALPLHCSSALIQRLSGHFPYRWQVTSLKYLGVHLTPAYSNLYGQNFAPLLRETALTLEKLRNLPLSFFGCIASVNLMILPKCLYLFETLPAPVLRRDMQKLQALLLNFIWTHKRYRLHRSVLYAPRSQGGLGVRTWVNIIKRPISGPWSRGSLFVPLIHGPK